MTSEEKQLIIALDKIFDIKKGYVLPVGLLTKRSSGGKRHSIKDFSSLTAKINLEKLLADDDVKVEYLDNDKLKLTTGKHEIVMNMEQKNDKNKQRC
jgi:hypothetical protein